VVHRTADFYFAESLVVSLAIAATAAWLGRPPWEAASLALVLPVCTAVSRYALPGTTSIWPTLDADLELLTRKLTGADGLAPARWGHEHPALRSLLELTYEGLIAAMAVAWIRDRFRWRLIIWLVVSAVAGFALYHVTPAAGPVHVRAGGLLGGDAWRNAVPSLHFTGALYVAAALWIYGAGWRIAGVSFAALTAASTVVGGQHYAVDLVPTVPFAVAVAWSLDRRWLRASLPAVLVAAWTVALRYHLLLDLSPAAVRLVSVATVLAACLTFAGREAGHSAGPRPAGP
jgi:hypothetical protein